MPKKAKTTAKKKAVKLMEIAETKKDRLVKLLSVRVYKLFDQEPRGSVQSPQLSQLAEDIINLK